MQLGASNISNTVTFLCVQDGAVAVAVWVVNTTVLLANIGDAKGVLARISDKV
jgi:hypothetical protein